jgi:hypothetical protein
MKTLYKSAEKWKDLVEGNLRARNVGEEVVSAAGFELEPFLRRLSRKAKPRPNGRDLLKEE